MAEFGINIDVVEDHPTIEKNALKKARQIAQLSQLPTLADDSGFFVEALNNQPGVRTARYAGVLGTSIDVRNKVLIEMKDKRNRAAFFQTAVVLAFPDGEYHITIGKVSGILLEVLKPLDYAGNFPFDPVFIPDNFNPRKKTFAEMTINEKNKISHRGLALKSFIEILQEETT